MYSSGVADCIVPDARHMMRNLAIQNTVTHAFSNMAHKDTLLKLLFMLLVSELKLTKAMLLPWRSR